MKTETLDPPERSAPPATLPIFRLKNILVPMDFSETSLKSLEYAVPLAKQFGGTITLVHVATASDHALDFTYPVPLEERRLAALKKQLEEIRAERIPAEIPVNAVVRQDRVFAAILEVANEIGADLIITSTHGRTGLNHLLLGSTAENITRRAPCPVLVVREHEHDFVVTPAGE